ncbi:MAG: electron transport complex subunit E [Bacteroidales bacterium]|jgi:electron transport complex protein RnfE|nr:electron transport complex subunit E [Bacteroidales bacterium]
MNKWKIFINGIIKENPIFVLLLGMCPTLGVTTSAFNGLGMGLATTFVLILSNIVISSLKNLIPDTVRIPAFIVVIASFVTVVDLLMQAYLPDLHSQLGLFIPLIVVNCLVLGRAEAFASKNGVLNSSIDGLGMGLGFTLALTILGLVRELLGNLSVFGYKLIETDGMIVFVLAPGAFLALGFLLALLNSFKSKKRIVTSD